MNEESLFHDAIAIEDPQQRAVFLDSACAGQPVLRAAVDALLAASNPASSFLDQPALTRTALQTASVATIERPGTLIGPYKLIEQIGEGGFGVVFLAEQQQPIRRRVALKTIKPGMDTQQVVMRFESERQALALMEHPHIARVLDGGATTSGRPYFVMELVEGIPITQYCDEHQLTPRERLALFVPVCQAVQHAHQKGIIHRDLKPSNVLVATQDGGPVPKVIDFGVAKALGQPLSEQTLTTGLGRIIGTLEYMSPEQAEFHATDIDTRADIYSLGVLLYELLTGTTPLTRDRFRRAAVSELLRVIREEEPPRPSTRLQDSKDMLASVSAQRKLEPSRLTRTVRGELDWIVMKCLEKDRNRRYATARDFALDLERYLSNEPVLAGAPSAAYRLRKSIRRHWRVLAGVSSFVILLVAAVIALSVALMAVDRERQAKEVALQAESRRRSQTRKALDAMTSQIIEDRLARKSVLLPNDKQFLGQALRYYEEFAADIGQDEEVRVGIANAYLRVCEIRRRLGDEAQAEIAARHAFDLYAALAQASPNLPGYQRDLARIHLQLGAIYDGTGRLQEAVAQGQQAVAIARDLARSYPDDHDHQHDLAMMLDRHAIMLKNTGRLPEAEDAYREALTMQKELSFNYPDLSQYRDELAAAVKVAEQFLEAAVEPGRDAYTAATLMAGSVRLVAEDETLSESQRRELGEKYGDLALAALRLAIERQAEEIAQIKSDPALDPIRSRQDFQDELTKLDRT